MPSSVLPLPFAVGEEAIVSNLPDDGDVWRFKLVSARRGEAALPEGIEPPQLDPDSELLAIHVEFTYVGKHSSVDVLRDEFELVGMIEKNGTWGPEVYAFSRSGSFPGEDWTQVPRDETHGYTLYYVVPRGFPFGALTWRPGGVDAVIWDFEPET
jgi:hypothetical protein